MTRAKHTPGPWSISDIDVPSVRRYIDNAAGHDGERDYYLAEVTHGDPDELEANAMLIAAAPELLAALQNILRVARAKGLTDAERAAALRDIREHASEAIAKAIGCSK